MSRVGFRQASGGARTALLLTLVAMLAWLGLSAFVVLVLTTLGVGGCDASCETPATAAVVGSLAVHLLAMVAAVVVVFRAMTTVTRVLLLAILALGVPVGTLLGSFALVSSAQG